MIERYPKNSLVAVDETACWIMIFDGVDWRPIEDEKVFDLKMGQVLRFKIINSSDFYQHLACEAYPFDTTYFCLTQDISELKSSDWSNVCVPFKPEFIDQSFVKAICSNL